MAKILLLWLEGPMQAWSTSSALYRRPTEMFPTKSALWGLIFNALGWYGRQKEALARVRHLPVCIYGYQAPALPVLRDYQTIGIGWDESDPWESMMVPKKENGTKSNGGGGRIVVKDYLCDARFAAFVSVPSDWEDDLRRGFANPAGTLYLGKKACLPSAPVYAGIYGTRKEAEAGLAAFLRYRYESEEAEEPFFSVEEADKYDPNGIMIADNPTAFGGVTECAPRYITVRRIDRR